MIVLLKDEKTWWTNSEKQDSTPSRSRMLTNSTCHRNFPSLESRPDKLFTRQNSAPRRPSPLPSRLQSQLMLEKEVRFQFTTSSGPGGQHVNKVHTRATIRWNVENSSLLNEGAKRRFLTLYANRTNRIGEVVLHCGNSRSRETNKADCLKRLEEMIAHAKIPPKNRRATRPTRSSVAKRLKSKKMQSVKKTQRNFDPKNND